MWFDRLKRHDAALHDIGHNGAGCLTICCCCGVSVKLRFEFWQIKQVETFGKRRAFGSRGFKPLFNSVGEI